MKPYLTIAEAAALLEWSTKQTRGWARRNDLFGEPGTAEEKLIVVAKLHAAAPHFASALINEEIEKAEDA